MRLRTVIALCAVGAGAAAVWLRPWRRHVSPSRLLDEFLPTYQFRDTVSLEVAAPPRRVLQAARAVTLDDMPLARLLGELRYLPARVVGRVPAAEGNVPFFPLLETALDALPLAETTGELVVGVVGRLHQPVDQQTQVIADGLAFETFEEPGYEKLAISLRAYEIGPDRSLLTVEHRTQALGTGARIAFGLYWLTIKPVGALATHLLLRAIARLAVRPLTDAERRASRAARRRLARASRRRVEPPVQDAAGVAEVVREMGVAIA